MHSKGGQMLVCDHSVLTVKVQIESFHKHILYTGEGCWNLLFCTAPFFCTHGLFNKLYTATTPEAFPETAQTFSCQVHVSCMCLVRLLCCLFLSYERHSDQWLTGQDLQVELCLCRQDKGTSGAFQSVSAVCLVPGTGLLPGFWGQDGS